MSVYDFMKVYYIKLNRRIKTLELELEEIKKQESNEPELQYELYIKELELEGAIEALKDERVNSKRDTDRILEDKYYMARLEIEGSLEALENEMASLKESLRT